MITIYGKPSCGYCDLAKNMAKKGNLEFEYKDITLTKFREELFSRAPVEVKTVPQIFVDGQYVGGYDKFVKYFSEKG